MPIDDRIMVNGTPKMLRLAAAATAATCLLAALAQAAQAQQRPGDPGSLPFLTAPLQTLTAPPPSPPPPSGRHAGAARGEADPERITQTGKIAYYGKRFAGRRTASGERFDPEALTMAHRTLPFGTRVRVTNLANGNSVILRVNDRGPSNSGRVADVSEAAAERLDMIRDGVVEARLEVLRVRTVR